MAAARVGLSEPCATIGATPTHLKGTEPMADSGVGPNYASPALRNGLIQEDHPGVETEFKSMTGAQMREQGIADIPSEYGGDGNFCVCVITYAAASGKKPKYGWKTAPTEFATKSGKRAPNPDDWLVLCSKAQGRALKRAGYPDDMLDLKALMHWRQRNAEVARIGLATVETREAIAPAETAALEGPKDEADAFDQKRERNPHDDSGIADAEILGDDAPDEQPPEAADGALHDAFGALTDARQADVRKWMKEHEIDVFDGGNQDLVAVVEKHTKAQERAS